ncbi:MAG: hypothetical protein ACK5WY_08010 [Holosporaceae bacterium]|jgi:hypothetical protein
MDMLPIDPTALVTNVSQASPLVSFLLLDIIILVMVVKVLFNRMVKLGEDRQTDLINSTLAINNNTSALNNLIKILEQRNG